MSTKFPGGIISKTPPVPSGAFENSTAPGVWTLEQQAAYAKLGQWPTAGNTQNFIEDVFSTWLYSGTGSSLTVSNEIDLSGKGGLTWIKNRSFGYDNALFDTARGANQFLSSNLSQAQASAGNMLNSFNNNGFTLGTDGYTGGAVNASGSNYVSWTFREQAKFFDIVTWTGDGTGARTFSHSLASEPACIIMRSVTSGANWITFHRGMVSPNATWWQNYMVLDDTQAANNAGTAGLSSAPTSTTFSVGSGYNTSGQTFVAYLFAHDAGGFGLNSTDNVISCGSFTTNSAREATVTLGYEPQWVMIKGSSGADDWLMTDIMRGASLTTYAALSANTSNAESAGSGGYYMAPTATGFLAAGLTASRTYIYIAIRRGPMRVPTDATKVFAPNAFTGDGSTTTGQLVTTNFPVDLSIQRPNRAGAETTPIVSRLQGIGNLGSSFSTRTMTTNSTGAEFASSELFSADSNTSIKSYGWPITGSLINWSFKRAPSFFDEVCYTGNDVLRTINHNLGVAPEMMIIKNRDSALDWAVYHTGIGNTKYIFLNSTAAAVTASTYWNDTSPTASVFTINTTNKLNSAPSPYVAYLFATCAGVSKVGSYTGNGTTQTINCGFGAGGARFVLIKRTDSTSGWYVYDTARGMTTMTNPYLFLNSSAAESATLGSVTTISTGFALNSTILAAINESGGTYIFLAIA